MSRVIKRAFRLVLNVGAIVGIATIVDEFTKMKKNNL